MADFTEEEKIDYIFKELKAQKRWKYFKWFFNIFLILGMIHVYYNIIPNLDKDKIIRAFSDNMIEFIRPITEDLVNDMIEREAEKAKESLETIPDSIKSNADLLKNVFVK